MAATRGPPEPAGEANSLRGGGRACGPAQPGAGRDRAERAASGPDAAEGHIRSHLAASGPAAAEPGSALCQQIQ
eukprot:4807084-Pyramimonas_sp.AAC.1